MLAMEESKKALLKMFGSQRVVGLDDLLAVLETSSRMSVFRRLKSMGYLTSFTNSGKYYTLSDIPDFDRRGLWFFGEVGFSRFGTLKATVVEVVSSSDRATTPKELASLLGLKISNALHNALRDLVGEGKIARHRRNGLALYVDSNPERARKQIEARLEDVQKAASARTPIPIETTIAILVEALQGASSFPAPSEVSETLQAKGIPATVGQVERVFSEHGISAEKKNAKRPSELFPL
jgi:hypothetical protein